MSKNIKEIGKELLGKSLNSFHRKTGLTQLEKNNEMQDGILDGILSQVDDAYIEKTEQSNVIHLEGSGDGVVVLDSIEGNTMVNLWKGSASLTLNWIQGDLTQEITNKILTVCNLTDKRIFFELSTIDGSNSGYSRGIHVEPNSKLKVTVTSNEKKRMTQGRFSDGWLDTEVDKFKKGVLVLEGNYTDKEINYFEGLQSSFEEKVNDEGKYEIEILCNNKNLINNSKSYQSSYASWMPNINSLDNIVKTDTYNATFNNRGVGFLVKDLKPNTQYTLSIPSLLTNNKLCYALYDDESSINSWQKNIQGQGNISTNEITFTTPNRKTVAVVGVYGDYNVLYNNGAQDGIVTIGNYRKLQLEVGNINSEFNSQKQNKIKVLLNEPLRAVGDVKDRLCVKDGKLMIERNIFEFIEDGSNDWNIFDIGENRQFYKYIPINLIKKSVNEYSKITSMSNNYGKTTFNERGNITSRNCALMTYSNSNNTNLLCIYKPLDFTTEQLKTELNNSPLKMCYQLAEPFYEEVNNEYGEPIILEGYENGTIYMDSTIVPNTTVRYTPKMESFKTLNEVNKNNNLITLDINENIIPYMMDVDYMIMEKELCLLNTKNIRKMEELDMTSMQKRTQDMLERLIKGKTLTEQECKTRVTTYLNAGKITDEQAEELMLVISEIYN